MTNWLEVDLDCPRNQCMLALGEYAFHLVEKQHELAVEQKWDPNHERLTKELIDEWAPLLTFGSSVLDVGCGSGLAQKHWERHGFVWHGMDLPSDMHHSKPLNFYRSDTNIVYARHVLEHSPFPAIALFYWMSLGLTIIVVVPEPDQRSVNQPGHISVWPEYAWTKLFKFLGLRIERYELAEYGNPEPWPQGGAEYRFLLRNKDAPSILFRK